MMVSLEKIEQERQARIEATGTMLTSLRNRLHAIEAGREANGWSDHEELEWHRIRMAMRDLSNLLRTWTTP